MEAVTGFELKEWRIANGMSQQQVASLLNVSIATVKRWENNQHQPSERLERKMRKLILSGPIGEQTRDFSRSWESRGQDESGEWSAAFAKGEQPNTGRGTASFPCERNSGLTEREFAHYLWRILHRACEPRSLPYPRTPEQRERVATDRIVEDVDLVLVGMFEQERLVRGLTGSKMLETILWQYFGEPKLSFQLDPSLDEYEK